MKLKAKIKISFIRPLVLQGQHPRVRNSPRVRLLPLGRHREAEHRGLGLPQGRHARLPERGEDRGHPELVRRETLIL